LIEDPVRHEEGDASPAISLKELLLEMPDVG